MLRLLLIVLVLGVSVAQEIQTLELELVIKAPPEILFNHVNPVVFTLTSPKSELQTEATGEIYKDDPELYWQTLNPVRWKFKLPVDMNTLEVHMTARLALCDKQQGLCYFEEALLHNS